MTFAMNQNILKIVRCPITQSALTFADDATVKRLNDAISAGTQLNRVGQTVEAPIDGGLVNEDQSFLIPIRGEIAIMVADQAIQL
jgi:uncharacterized protein YbaR (Trm112 family)